MLRPEYLDLTLRDVLALARGTGPDRHTPIAIEEITAALEQLVKRLALADARSVREQRAWLADQVLLVEAIDADA